MAKKIDTKINLNESLKELQKIVSWFESQEEVDVEEGLTKVREGVALIRASKERLKEVENEFEEIKREMENE